MLQIRPNHPDAVANRFYSPQRDLANCGPYLIRAAVMFVDAGKHSPEMQAFLSQHGMTEDDLVHTVAKLRDMLNLVIKHKSPAEAMDEVGFESMPLPARIAFFYTMGQVLFSSVWAAVKDVTVAGTRNHDLDLIINDITQALTELRQPLHVSSPPKDDNPSS